MPTLAEKPMPSANDHQGSETGKPDTQCTSRPIALPNRMPMHAADRRQEDGFDQELPQDLAAARAERLADADLARPLGHRDHHDRHHADAADHQRDRADDDERQERRLADLIPDLEQRVLRAEIEVVRLIEAQAVADAHQRFDLGIALSRLASSRGTTAIIAERNIAGVMLPDLIFADPLSTLP